MSVVQFRRAVRRASRSSADRPEGVATSSAPGRNPVKAGLASGPNPVIHFSATAPGVRLSYHRRSVRVRWRRLSAMWPRSLVALLLLAIVGPVFAGEPEV